MKKILPLAHQNLFIENKIDEKENERLERIKKYSSKLLDF